MYIKRVISYGEGWNIFDKNEELKNDLNSIIEELSFNNEERSSYLYSTSRHILNKYGYSSLNQNDKLKLRNYSVFIPFHKNQVSIRFIFTDISGSFPTWLFVEVPKSNLENIIDLPILIILSNEFENNLENEKIQRIRFFSESKFDELIKNYLSLNYVSPFLIFIISNNKIDNFAIEELILNEELKQNSYLIEKSIEFAPEYFQAGMGILAYFGEVLKRKYPNNDASVRIVQEKNIVKLQIESKEGEIEIIEETLENYSLVISNQANIDILYDKPTDVIALKQKLEIAGLEIRQTKELLALSQNLYTSKISSMEDELSFMRRQFENQSIQVTKNQKLVSQISSSNEKIILAQINQSSIMLENIINSSNISNKTEELIYTLLERIQSGIDSKVDENEIKKILLDINDEDKNIIKEIEEALKNISYGVSGNIAYQILTNLFH